MQELVKVTEGSNGELLVSARELYDGLEIESKFNDWFNRMLRYGFEKDMDYTTITQKKVTAQGNESEYKDYILKIDCAKEIAMIQRNEKGKQVRKYFIQCEKELKKNKLPTSYKDALIELVRQIEEKERIEEEKQRLVHSLKTYTTTEIAKELGFRSANALNRDLENKKLQYKVNGTWVLCARFSELGYVNIKQMELDNGIITYDRKWTGTGRDWLVNEIYKSNKVLITD